MSSLPDSFRSMNLSTMTPTLRLMMNMFEKIMYTTKKGAKIHCWLSRMGSVYWSTLSHAAYITSAQPSVVEISKSVSMALRTLSKLWLKVSSQRPPCSTQAAASLISGSQYWLHSHAAAHSERHAMHSAEVGSDWQVSLQKVGCFSQSSWQPSAFSGEAPSGQKACRQLSSSAVFCTSPEAFTTWPPHGSTSCRPMACMNSRPRRSSEVMEAKYSALLLPGQSDGSSLTFVKGLGQSHSGGRSVSPGSLAGSQRPTQMGVSTVARTQDKLWSGQPELPHESCIHTERLACSAPLGQELARALLPKQRGVLKSLRSLSRATDPDSVQLYILPARKLQANSAKMSKKSKATTIRLKRSCSEEKIVWATTRRFWFLEMIRRGRSARSMRTVLR
mmetsp:Transcript_31127/g.71856  ORF Transcript_31127/g.71856 Transcript_31127/m.71856 type:complete len:390 (-) Transcript_31127:1177-2346(-)